MIRTVFSTLVALGITGMPAAAQDSVVLQLHPRVGDTLRTVMQQTIEVSDITAGSGNAKSKHMSSTTTIYSSSIVRAVRGNSTTVATTVDSVRHGSTDDHTAKAMANTSRALEGQRVILTLGADGTVQTAVDARGTPIPPGVVDALASIPAVFSRQPVKVGEEWKREMMLPSGGPFGAKGSAGVHAVFRLDSLQKGSSQAYVSMRGDIVADSTKRGVMLTGSMNANVQLDRTRGWITDSQFVVILESEVRPPANTHLAPMRFLTRVSQRLRTLASR